MLGIADQTSRYSLLERLQCVGECVRVRLAEAVEIPTQAKGGLEWATVRLRFAEQQMNMLGHDYIAINVKSVTAPHPLQG
jgi:hypothetical protein